MKIATDRQPIDWNRIRQLATDRQFETREALFLATICSRPYCPSAFFECDRSGLRSRRDYEQCGHYAEMVRQLDQPQTKGLRMTTTTEIEQAIQATLKTMRQEREDARATAGRLDYDIKRLEGAAAALAGKQATAPAKHKRTNLTPELRQQVADAYAKGGVTYDDVAAQFGIASSSVNRIVLAAAAAES